MEVIKLKGINKVVGRGKNRLKILNDISLNIEEGEMIAIEGVSGAGKSTLLNIIGLLDSNFDGDYILSGETVKNFNAKKTAEKRNSLFGFIIQDYALVEYYSVKENLEIPFIYRKNKISKKEEEEIILNTLERLKIRDKLSTKASKLSGGERQRVAIARALINNPRILLADEPTGALDTDTAMETISFLKEFNKEGKTVIIVTHDKNVSKECQRIIRIKDGRIVDSYGACL